MTTQNQIFGQRLRNFRNQNGISQIDMMIAIGRKSRTAVFHRESGRTAITVLELWQIKTEYPLFDVDAFLSGGQYDE